MNTAYDLLRELGYSLAELAVALDLETNDLDRWLHGELRPETADVIEVRVSLLALQLRHNEQTQRIRVA